MSPNQGGATRSKTLPDLGETVGTLTVQVNIPPKYEGPAELQEDDAVEMETLQMQAAAPLFISVIEL